MSIIFVMLPAALVLALAALAAFVWAAKGGQFDDLDTPPVRSILDDDDDA